MNVLTFLMISLIVHAIPIPFSSEYLKFNHLLKWLPFRLVWGTIAWAIICLLSATTLPWAILSLIMSLGIIIMVTSGFRPGGDFEQMLEGIRVPFTCIGVIIIILLPTFSGVISWTADVSNAWDWSSQWRATHHDIGQLMRSSRENPCSVCAC